MEFKIFKRKKSRFSVNDEVSAIYETLIASRTFKAFCKNNQVFDMHKSKQNTNKNKLFSIYKNGIGSDSSFLIINRN